MTHYEVLGVDPAASPAEVRRAYVHLARRHHPDFHAASDAGTRRRAEERMQRINAAWAVLGESAARAAYDESLRRPVTAPVQPTRVPGASHPDFVPLDPDDDKPDPRLLDDTPYNSGASVPRWQQLAPPALAVAALLAGSVALVTSIRALLGLAVVALVLALLGFALTPLLAVLRGYDPDPER